MIKNNHSKLYLLFVLFIMQSLIALVWLILIPGEKSTAFIFHISLQRLALVLIPAGVVVVSVIGLLVFNLNKQRKSQIIDCVKISKHRLTFGSLFTGLSATLLVFTFLNKSIFEVNTAVFQRLLPLLCLFILIFFQIGVALFHNVMNIKKILVARNWLSFIFPFIFFVLFINLGIWAGVGSILESPFYMGIGAPILPNQFIIILYFLVIFLLIYKLIPLRSNWFNLQDIVFCLFLFVFAVILWSNTPIPVNHFTHTSNFANNELFPYSDSRIYDLNAQQMLLGNGLAGGNPLPRPLYSFFIGLLHVLFGQSLRVIILVQTFFLALVPVGLYRLGKHLFNPGVGLASALFLIIRETNQAFLSSFYTLSSVRMLMTEIFMMGFLIVLSVVVIKWLQEPESHPRALLAGIILGLSALIRTQTLLLGAVILVFLFIQMRKIPRRMITPVLMFLFSLSLIVLLWTGRNAIRSHQFVFEDTAYASRTVNTIFESGSSNSGFMGIIDSVGKFTKRNVSFLVNSSLSSLYQFPWDWNSKLSLQEFVANELDRPALTNPNIDRGQYIVMLLHLLIIGIGLAKSWQKNKFPGLLPAGIYLGYNLSSSVAGFSGWRFIQPVDWVVLMYWAIGFVEFIKIIIGSDNNIYEQPRVLKIGGSINFTKKIMILAALLIALLIPVGESLFPKISPELDRNELLAKLDHNNVTQNTQRILNLALDTNTYLQNGTILYPRYLKTQRDFWQNGVTEHWMGGHPELIFEVVSSHILQFYAPISNQKLDSFPNFVPVIIVSCGAQDLKQAVAVLELGREPTWVFINETIPTKCNN